MQSDFFARFAADMGRLDLARVQSPRDIPETFLLGRQGPLSSYYVPFDYVNPKARLVLVGITPGFTQWKNAMREAQDRLRGGATHADALRAAKQTGAFSGAMRPNLIALLDHIGLNRWLQLPSCEALFGAAGDLIQTTSILRHPVFVDGANYNGAPGMTRSEFLKAQIEQHFANEARSLPDAVYIPLGPKVSEGLDWLVARGVVPPDKVLHGLPHPSGANAERIAYFLGRKAREALSAKTDAAKLDAIREQLQVRVAALGPLN
ncbi:hypothetical protein [Burkholderia sp. Ac-20365]|uniref:hypothetical protein n=1 Tax=Burkholderia sp. Ac-20365 TaxID=2703897 RepID=UPI00197B4B30|nr:hypothetical protein [Burkholderia sp. Ac-20365]MBN3761239.1 hypothetical protein [Burkholderia sp. Ac-20365]